ncbi:MAG: glucan biosynthesis protein [Verrucomicrobiales bacterium]
MLGLPIVAAQAVEKLDVTLEYVSKLAEERARSPFKSPRGQLPPELSEQNLNYDRYREIRFNRDQALWRHDKLPFWTEFFHPGYIYQEPVRMHEFTVEGYAQPIRFVPDFFDYSKLPELRDKIPADTGYAGFKLLHALNKPDVMDELGVFQGATYFRLLGKGQRYGLSARGLALNCGEGEEFPLFTDFWLGKPRPDSREIALFVILDSKTCAGAYRFIIRPGETTLCDVDGVLFFRPDAVIKASYDSEKLPWNGIKTVGVAPLTSMFWFGENTEHKPDDYRGEVHDSDGLLVQLDGGEVVWRPLNNPPRKDEIRHSVFTATNPRGFGLLQRDRDHRSYQEIFNYYHQVPSVLVKPKGDWGEGQVRLVEIGTINEYLDNVVAFWNPKSPPAPMKAFPISYQLQVMMGTEHELSPNSAKATRVGASLQNAKVRQFAIDFGGPALDKLAKTETLEAVASCSPNAHLSENQCLAHPFENSWRVSLKLEPAADNKEPVGLRCTLKKGATVLTETWDYQWIPR